MNHQTGESKDWASLNVADIVVDNYRTATVFKKFGLDFCCGGRISLRDACEKHQIDLSELTSALEDVSEQQDNEVDVNAMQIDVLSDYIEEKHHTYVRERIPEIEPFLSKLVRVHGEKNPELKKVEELFGLVKEELLAHMPKEEKVLFPYVKEMITAKNEGNVLERPHFGTIKNPITVMEAEHTSAGDAFKEIRDITNNLTPPEHACNTYRTVFSLLEEFEEDLHQHIHLENNILFPKAIALEEELLA